MGRRPGVERQKSIPGKNAVTKNSSLHTNHRRYLLSCGALCAISVSPGKTGLYTLLDRQHYKTVHRLGHLKAP